MKKKNDTELMVLMILDRLTQVEKAVFKKTTLKQYLALGQLESPIRKWIDDESKRVNRKVKKSKSRV